VNKLDLNKEKIKEIVIIPREGKESNNNEMMNREEMNHIES
jgi:hypothetical protein